MTYDKPDHGFLQPDFRRKPDVFGGCADHDCVYAGGGGEIFDDGVIVCKILPVQVYCHPDAFTFFDESLAEPFEFLYRAWDTRAGCPTYTCAVSAASCFPSLHNVNDTSNPSPDGVTSSPEYVKCEYVSPCPNG